MVQINSAILEKLVPVACWKNSWSLLVYADLCGDPAWSSCLTSIPACAWFLLGAKLIELIGWSSQNLNDFFCSVYKILKGQFHQFFLARIGEIWTKWFGVVWFPSEKRTNSGFLSCGDRNPRLQPACIFWAFNPLLHELLLKNDKMF